MHNIRKITKDMFFVGGDDRRIELFENVFPVKRGVSYNSYLVMDEKTVLLDTVDASISEQFFENIEFLLKGRNLDYLIINHMEPDHCANIKNIILKYNEVKIVGNNKTLTMIEQFFDFDIEKHFHLVKEGDILESGVHKFHFVMAPMVHWPEAMVTYDETDKVLYSADAFGSFGAMDGNLYADEVDFEKDFLDEARRYYTNIVGKYGNQVIALLKKASGLEIDYICPLHGFVWRKNIDYFIEKYVKWAKYEPEEKGLIIAYASVYGNTESTANILASMLSEGGVKNIKMYDTSKIDPSYIVSEAFRVSHIVFAATTYNAGIFVNMENLLHDLKAHNLQNRSVAIIENGSWAPTSGKLMSEILSSMKGINILNDPFTIKSSLKEEQLDDLKGLKDMILDSYFKKSDIANDETEENQETQMAMFKISYGLFIASSNYNDKDAGCVINAVSQVTDTPKRVQITINKNNYTHEAILKSKKFNLSILSTEVPFNVFENFGFRSSKDCDKFGEIDYKNRSSNGVYYLANYANAFISGKVVEVLDVGTHSVFIGEVVEGGVLNEEKSVTYEYYFDHIKPKPQSMDDEKEGYICKICGYFYEGENLPEDYICPLCKHGVDDFEKVTPSNEPKKEGYVCSICGYIYEGENLSEDYICPLCKHPATDFKKL